MLLLVRQGLEPEVVAAQRAIFGLRFVHDWNVRGDRKSQSDVRVGAQIRYGTPNRPDFKADSVTIAFSRLSLVQRSRPRRSVTKVRRRARQESRSPSQQKLSFNPTLHTLAIHPSLYPR